MSRQGPPAARAVPRIGGAAKRLTASLVIAATVVGASSLASAHPDIAIEDRVTFAVKEGRIAAIEETWTFDRDYSLSFLSEYKTEPDRGISRAVADEIAKRVQPNLAEVRYFTY